MRTTFMGCRWPLGSGVLASCLWLSGTLLSPKGYAQKQSDSVRVSGALQWFNEWIYPIELHASTVCTGKQAAEHEVLYCAPENVEVDIQRDPREGRVIRVHVAPADSYDEVFRNPWLPFKIGSASLNAVRLELGARDLARPRIRDTRASMRFHDRAQSFLAAAPLQQRLDTVAYYPWVCETDPEYDVYLVKAGKVETVWVFVIFDGAIDGPSFAFDGPHNNIPRMAENNVKDRDKWFAISPLK